MIQLTLDDAQLRQEWESVPAPIRERLRVEGQCWVWIGPRYVQQGYGEMSVDGRPRRVHRVVYREAVGPVPAGVGVLHRCDNPPCCRPSHLFLGTQADNAADMKAKGRSRNRACGIGG